jgi:glycosyltransferase involved in cell wall biosynthesis
MSEAKETVEVPKLPPASTSKLKVAIVCDWLTGIGGAERVVLELHKLYPEAPIYTSQYDPGNIDWFAGADVRTTWLQKLPASLKKFLPLLRAWTFSRLDLSDYDLVLSSSGAEAKGVRTKPKPLSKRRLGMHRKAALSNGRKRTETETYAGRVAEVPTPRGAVNGACVHICYCHSPTHYYWIRSDEYLKHPGFPFGLNWLARWGLRLLINPLKRWDKRAAQQPDYLVANSTHTQAMIKRHYRRDSVVVHPPVEVDRFKLRGKPVDAINPLGAVGSLPLRHGFIVAGRQTPYKRFDLAIQACDELKVPLIVIGDGPDHKRLEKLAGRGTTFLSNVNDEEIVNHFCSALGFIMPNMDDFGIVAVEALAAGTPVIAYNKGGALDYVIPGKTGLFFEKQTVKNLASVLETTTTKTFDYPAIAEHAAQFSVAAFRKNFVAVIKNCLAERTM